jgi:lipid II:glycine glycyltransferase (peptidoglycan interpeptide bridge formation enzyme)
MHAEILTKEQYKKWDDFAHSHPYSSIHQTSKWAHFQSNVPSRDKYWIIALFDDESAAGSSQTAKSDQSTGQSTKPIKFANPKIIAGTVLIKHKLPKNYSWLYAPRGPLLSYENQKLAKEQMSILLNEIKGIAKEEKAIFLRIDPLIEIEQPLNPKKSSKFHDSPKSAIKFPSFHFSHLGYQPEDTLIIDLNKPEEEILKQMKEKGRYNIRLAAKKGVKIVEVRPVAQADAQSKIESYFKILQETLQRDKFYGHGIGFYKNMIEKLAPNQPDRSHDKDEKSTEKAADYAAKDTAKAANHAISKGFAKMYLAEYMPDTPAENHCKTTDKKYIAGIIVTFYKNTAIYYYGASSNEHRNLMAPYLLQWHAMKEAKSLGCTKYDLLGIAPPTMTKNKAIKDELGPKNHTWRGVTEFKRKFGGTHVKYLPPQEYSFKPLPHFLYKFLKKLRKTLR